MLAHKTPEQVLQEYWGFSSFRSNQLQIINSVLEGKDTLAILPTGGGKSICFQVPALLKEGCCLVISPLIALMEDQVQRLQSMGIPAKAIVSGMNQWETDEVLEACSSGNLKFLYVSPERLETRAMESSFAGLPINLIAVDESHCISQWGYDFRPSYLNIATIRPKFKNVPVIALTASATPKVKEDILTRLEMKTPQVFMNTFSRENLIYDSINCEEKTGKIISLLEQMPGSSIIYCRTRRRTKEISDLLQQHGFSADYYHAGLEQDVRKEKQQTWILGGTRIMVCTNAFGMGIDKPNVRVVIHADIPDCLENYYQEAGRAGRDGEEAHAILLYRNEELEMLRALPDQRFPSMTSIRKVYHALANHHQLPTGTGAGSCFDLELETFVEKFKLSLNDVIYSLQTLKQEHVIHYMDRVYMPSTVQFVCGRDYLEQIEQEYPSLEPIIKILLRTYTGIYDMPVRISERQIAWKLHTEADRILTALKFLDDIGAINYVPKKETPQVCYLQHRVKADELEIDHAAYQLRKQLFRDRIELMIQFATGKKCKSVLIGNYFGDSAIEACGKCDCCKSLHNFTKENTLCSDVLRLLSNKSLEYPELRKALKAEENKLLEVLQFLRNQEKIKMEHDGRIGLK